MSNIVRINFERIADECHAVCDRMSERVAGLEEMLDIFNQYSDEDIDDQSNNQIEDVREQAEVWNNEIEHMRTKADWLASKGVLEADSDDDIFRERYELKDEAYTLMRSINAEVAALKPQLYVLNKTIKAFRKERWNREKEERRMAYRNRQVAITRTDEVKIENQKERNENITSDANRKTETRNPSPIDSIKDEVLRQFSYMARLSHPNLQGEELLREGRRMMEDALKEAAKEEAEKEKIRCIAEMEGADVDRKEIKSVMSIDVNNEDALNRIYEQTAESIVGETIRKKSLKMILKAIKAQGFITDKNSIVRNGDTVTLTARKVGGETAKFNVYLDGHFIYDFHGYEGQACQKDIEPFIKDLEEIYGFTIKESEEIWRNPDKIGVRKMQNRISDTNKH